MENLIDKEFEIKEGIGGRCVIYFYDGNKFLLKQSNHKEIKFYKKLNQSDEILIKFKIFLPKIIKYKENYLFMKNIFYKKECYDIMDFKLGCFTKHIFGNYKKQKSKINKSINSSSHELGFRIDGYLIKSENNNIIKKQDKKCLKLNKIDCIKLVQNFFKINSNLNNIINKIKFLIKIIENDKFPFMFFNCSLIIGLNNKENIIKLIDFQNTLFNDNYNINYIKINNNNIIKGLKNLIKIISNIDLI